MPKTSKGRPNREKYILGAVQKVSSLTRGWKSSLPIVLRHPEAAEQAAKTFLKGFSGQVMFAVKANSSPDLLQILWNAGVHAFDVASIQEVRAIHSQFPEAAINFMNPVKNKHAIQEAYFMHNVRTFALDSHHELDKILKATNQLNKTQSSLTLCVRIATEAQSSKLPLGNKFGVKDEKGHDLLIATEQAAHRLGICFHVGSQTMNPDDFTQALHHAHDIVASAGVDVDVVDVGGGFPVRYPGMEPPPLRDYFTCIQKAIQALPLFRVAEVWAEPGRTLCAEYNSLIVHVEEVRGQSIYFNDGVWGNLCDAGRLSWPLEAVLLREKQQDQGLQSFRLFGPCCDREDVIASVPLPQDVQSGEHIWFQKMGAYSTVLRTEFCAGSSLPNRQPAIALDL